ncbi:hypothetical protein [Marinobacter sp. KMM 10035]|uniref:hypothetical protein n=1 Tax=Marinobacter sp. KMM 10035 TaxID=3134034 RepID=UPI00397D135F
MSDFVNAFIRIVDLFLNPKKNGFPVLVALIGLTIAFFGYNLFISGIQEGGAALSIAYGDNHEFNLGKGGPGLIFCFFGMGLIVYSIRNYSKIRVSPDASSTEDIDGLQEIHPKNITKEFDVLLSNAGRWRYKGNFGRYMRGKVLPTLASKANFHISVCIIDPNNRELCEEHARYRNSINSIDKGKKYDLNSVALEVVVTIIICAWYVTNKNIAIDLHLTSVFDPVRIDANDDAMIITVEDRRSPALKITNGHFMFEHFDLQMQFSRQQAKRVTLTGLKESDTVASIEEIDIDSFLESIGMKELCRTLGPANILNACRNVRNPYEN